MSKGDKEKQKIKELALNIGIKINIIIEICKKDNKNIKAKLNKNN